jgi:hypothetical protein
VIRRPSGENRGSWKLASREKSRSARPLRSTSSSARFEEAEPLLLDAHRKLVAGWGATSPYTVSAARDLVRLYEAWERPALAATYRGRSPAP